MWHFRLTSFTLHNVLKVHSCCNMYQNLIPFCGQIIFPSMNIIHFLHSSAEGIWVVSYFLAIVNKTAMDIHVQVFVWTYGNYNILQNCWTIFQSSCTIPVAIIFWILPFSYSTMSLLWNSYQRYVGAFYFILHISFVLFTFSQFLALVLYSSDLSSSSLILLFNQLTLSFNSCLKF